jgi:hypothetical protein
MDPYLESHWRDVHHRLITYASDAIQDALPAQLRACVEERVVLEGPEGLGNPLFPDARAVEHRPQPRGGATAVIRFEATEALIVEAEQVSVTEGYIEIIDASSGNRVVTIIEVLSPTNKLPGDGRQEYLRKQREIVQSDTNLVEIDLLLSGRHTAAVPLDHIPSKRRTYYTVCVRRVTARGKAEVYPVYLDHKLPTVSIPLRPEDADVPLDLQAMIEQCYRKGRYEVALDYQRDPDSPFPGPVAEWIDEFLRGKGVRPTEAPKKKRKRKPPE